MIFALLLTILLFICPKDINAASLILTVDESEIQVNQEFYLNFEGNQEPETEYYIKARIGVGGELNKAQTLNETTQQWLSDSSAWASFPVVTTDTEGNFPNQSAIKVRTKEDVEIGSNDLVLRIREVGKSDNINSNPISINIISITPTDTPSPTETPTSTPMPTEEPEGTYCQGTYKINEVKDGNDEVLSSVKIYVDDEYIHGYPEKTLTFCDGCKCYDGYGDCSLGQHTIRLEKSGYQDWTETIEINASDSKEAHPTMNENEPTNTPTPSPTPSSTPTPTLEMSPSPEEEMSNLLSENKEAGTSGQGFKVEISPPDEGEILGIATKRKQSPLLLIITMILLGGTLTATPFIIQKAEKPPSKEKIKKEDKKEIEKIEEEIKSLHNSHEDSK